MAPTQNRDANRGDVFLLDVQGAVLALVVRQ